MRRLHALLAFAVLAGCSDTAPGPGAGAADDGRVVIRTSVLLDGTGEVLRDQDIVVVDGIIEEIRPHSGTATFDLTGLTVLPGLIDTHVHLGTHFDPDGKTHTDPSESGEASALYAAEHAYLTLMAGFTTVQSIGGRVDAPVRDAIARGTIPGPRVLTSLQAVGDADATPEELRLQVRALHDDGADVIKIFASRSIRDAGTPTLSQEQLDAVCEEATGFGLRSVVHAHGPVSAQRAARAGCTTIEHGALLDQETLDLLAERGLFFDPNVGLVVQNYIENKDRYLGVGNYTEEGFRYMEDAQTSMLGVFKMALETSSLRLPMGTDATAGAHGQNVREILVRVLDGGQPAHDAIVDATYTAAASLGLEDELGTLRPGLTADVIAVVGDPLQDINVLRGVSFVMKGGTVFKSVGP